MSNPVVHFEVVGTHAAALQSFYTQVFDWKIDANNPLQYGSVEAEPGGIGGGVCPTIDGSTRTLFTWVSPTSRRRSTGPKRSAARRSCRRSTFPAVRRSPSSTTPRETASA